MGFSALRLAIILILIHLSYVIPYDVDIARRICAVGKARGVSDFVMLSAIETCIVESGCRNVPYGDRDSVGVFQQRRSWGTYEERMNVEIAAGKYFVEAKKCNKPTAGQLAQCVQRSAFPAKYDQKEVAAKKLMAEAGNCGTGIPHTPGSGAYNEAPCSSVGHCYNRDSEKCSGSSQGTVGGKFACPSQPDNIVCCVGGNAETSSVRNEHPCSSVGHCYNRNSEKCDGSSQEKVGEQFACPSQPDNIVCCVKSVGAQEGNIRNEHPCSTVGSCYDRNSGMCPEDRQAIKVGGEWSCPTQPDNIICCRNAGGKPAASPGLVPNEAPCSESGFCFEQDTHSCPTGKSGPKTGDGRFVCPTQKDSIICCFN